MLLQQSGHQQHYYRRPIRKKRTTTSLTTSTTLSLLLLVMLTSTTLLRLTSAFRTTTTSLTTTTTRVSSSRVVGVFSSGRRQPGLLATTSTRLYSATSDDSSSSTSKKKSKWKDDQEFFTKEQLALMEEQYDEFASKHGFGSDNADFDTFHTSDATFEDDFKEEDYLKPTVMDSTPNPPQKARQQSMKERIEEARRGLALGKVVVPQQLEEIAQDAKWIKKLGYKQEDNPYGYQETPRKREFVVTVQDNPLICNACGSKFQTHNEYLPGYLPPTKMEFQQKMLLLKEKKDWYDKIQNKDREWSSEDEVKYLIETVDKKKTKTDSEDEASTFDLQEYARNELGIDPMDIDPIKKIICKRCHGLQNFGTVDEALRPRMDTTEPLLSQEEFRKLLYPLKDKKCVILALVDLFDFAGSVLPELDGILGKDSENPVVLAANKADLMPKQMGPNRIENWIRRELEYMGIDCINKSDVRGNVRLISCRTGAGVNDMLDKVRNLSDKMDSAPVYVVGAANAGKSTLLNWIIEKNKKKNESSDKQQRKKYRAGNANQRKGALTVSPVPGTTLQFIEVSLGDGRKLYDTPGLLVPGTFTNLLTPKELKMVVPKHSVEPVTFRVGSGKCVLLGGGLARIEVLDDTRPFLLTFFVANSIKLHPTDHTRVQEVLSNHVGEMLTPPIMNDTDNPNRLKEWKEKLQDEQQWETHDVTIQGLGWKEAAADVALCGLGWIAVTGAGTAKLRIVVPKGIGVYVRPPLMPFDIWSTTAKYTGSKATRKSSKSKWTGKRRRGVGRR